MNSFRFHAQGWTLDEKDCTHSLRTDSTDDECNDEHIEPFEEDNLNSYSPTRKYSEASDPLKYKT